jgi:hypothetical protein
MGHGDIVAVHRIVVPARPHPGVEMGDDLVAEEIEIDPVFGASAFAAIEEIAVESAGGGEVVDGKSEMERRELGHGFRFYVIPAPGGID